MEFIIVSDKLNRVGVPQVWQGQRGWSDVHFFAHRYKDAKAADQAILRNRLTNGKRLPYEEFCQRYNLE